MSDGMVISSRALMGEPKRGWTSATHSGSSRSKAAAKMTRVEERNTVPDQPKNHRLISNRTMNWMMGLLVRKAANRAG